MSLQYLADGFNQLVKVSNANIGLERFFERFQLLIDKCFDNWSLS